MSRDAYARNAEAEWRAGVPRPKPCGHETTVEATRHADPDPISYCAECGRRMETDR